MRAPFGLPSDLLMRDPIGAVLLTILFEIITFQIRKPLNHVTVVAENS